MRTWEIVRFEIAYQARRPWTWAYVVALFAIALRITLEAYVDGARDQGTQCQRLRQMRTLRRMRMRNRLHHIWRKIPVAGNHR